jgi:hypothetical protein
MTWDQASISALLVPPFTKYGLRDPTGKYSNCVEILTFFEKDSQQLHPEKLLIPIRI